MRTIVGFVKSTTLGGLLFVLPVVLLILVAGHAVRLAKEALAPVEARLPDLAFGGMASLTILALIVLLTICFIAGLLGRTRGGRALTLRLEAMLLNNLPAYQLLKSMTQGMASLENTNQLRVVMARIEDAWQLAFLTEDAGNGLLAVYVPGAPSPMSGSLFFLTPDRIKPLNISLKEAMLCIRRLGLGSRQLLAGRADLT